MSYNGAIGGVPPFPNVASTSQGIPGAGHSGMSGVDKVRVKQNRRSGRVKVMILLEIDDVV